MGVVCAETQQYSLEIPDGQGATFELPFAVDHAGELVIHATWLGLRPLSFRVNPPTGTGITHRRTGPSPVSIRIPVAKEQTGSWMLIIHALPLRGASSGLLTIEPPAATAIRLRELPPAGASVPQRAPLEIWQQPRLTAENATDEEHQLLQATESFRALLVEAAERAPDSCRWQDDLLQWLAAQRDRTLDEGAQPAAATGKLMTRLAAAVREVEELRAAVDPLLIGPVPADPRIRASWLRMRGSKLLLIERELDDLLTKVQRNHAPELEGQTWPLRMVSCLTAAERYFEQRWIVGVEAAPNRELAQSQWGPMLEAGKALGALGRLGADEPIRLRSPRR